MTNQEIADQKRLSDILRLARLQLNEEFMSGHSSAQSNWLNSARTAWTTSGVLLPFANKFVYPTEEEVVARGVKIYNSLNAQPAAPAAPAVVSMVVKEPAIVQAGGDIVLIDEPVAIEEPAAVVEVAPTVEESEPVVELTPIIAEAAAPQAESMLESKFKSLFTKWGGKGNY